MPSAFRVDLFNRTRVSSGHATAPADTLEQGRVSADEIVSRSDRDGMYRRAEVRPEGAMWEFDSQYTVSAGTLPSRCRETLSQEA